MMNAIDGPSASKREQNCPPPKLRSEVSMPSGMANGKVYSNLPRAEVSHEVSLNAPA